MEDKEQIDQLAEAYSKRAQTSRLTGKLNTLNASIALLNEIKEQYEKEMCEIRGHIFPNWQEQKIVDDKLEARFVHVCEFCGEVQKQNEVPSEYVDTEGKKVWLEKPGQQKIIKRK